MNLEKSKQRGSWEDSRACLSPSTGAGEQRIGAASARAESRFGTGRLCNEPKSPKLLLRSTALCAQSTTLASKTARVVAPLRRSSSSAGGC